MSRIDVQSLLGYRINPSPERAATREYEGMRTLLVDDGKFEIAIKGRGMSTLPHSTS
jgi:hypothetical protein